MKSQQMKISSHAQSRMQQRAINMLQMQLIQDFGDFIYQKGGERIAFIERETLNKLRQAIDQLDKVQVVFGESDKVITVMHQTKKIKKSH